MATTWTLAVDWDRNGNFTGDYDDITEYVIEAKWFLGMREPYKDYADDSMLRLTLNNADQRFSPENSESPLYGKLASFRPVKITSHDGETERAMWTGWIESIQPDVGQYGGRRVKVTAAGPMQFFKGAETDLVVQENKRADEIIQALVEAVHIPARLDRITLLDTPGYCELDSTA